MASAHNIIVFAMSSLATYLVTRIVYLFGKQVSRLSTRNKELKEEVGQEISDINVA